MPKLNVTHIKDETNHLGLLSTVTVRRVCFINNSNLDEIMWFGSWTTKLPTSSINYNKPSTRYLTSWAASSQTGSFQFTTVID